MSDKSCCGGTSAVKVKKKKDTCACSGSDCCTPESSSSNSEIGLAPDAVCRDNTAAICERWITGYIRTPVGEIPQVSTSLDFSDKFGFFKCRWSIGRMDYTVEPGLYCVGAPDDRAPVLVTANYKMTFDKLREQLTGIDAWIVVLDTDGINVWCAAGKGTFGTEELVQRIKSVGLDKIVSHRTLILPQLGATGVSAHEVKRLSGFSVAYGPIRANDVKTFLASGMVATKEMRTVNFPLIDRLVLTPMELVSALTPILLICGVMFILNAIGIGRFSLADLYALLGAVVVGCVLTPVLLPWIPGRAFAFKGALLGLLWAVAVNLLNGFPAMPYYGWLKAAAFMLVLPSISAFGSMNFTGSSTYTSLSGVDKEMKIALPIMIIATIIGIILIITGDVLAAVS